MPSTITINTTITIEQVFSYKSNSYLDFLYFFVMLNVKLDQFLYFFVIFSCLLTTGLLHGLFPQKLGVLTHQKLYV